MWAAQLMPFHEPLSVIKCISQSFPGPHYQALEVLWNNVTNQFSSSFPCQGSQGSQGSGNLACLAGFEGHRHQPGRCCVPIKEGSVTAHRALLQVLSKELLDSVTHEPYGQETPPPSSAFSKDSVSGSYSFIGFLSLDYDCYNDTSNHVLGFGPI